MLTNSGHVAPKNHSDGVLTRPISQTLATDIFTVGLESADDARRAQIYEEVKNHPLAGLIGLFSDADESAHVEDASMNVHKYIAEYHAEQHAKLSN